MGNLQIPITPDAKADDGFSNFELKAKILHEVRKEWNALFEGESVDQPVIDDIGIGILVSYSEASRHYHTFEHLYEMLNHINAVEKNLAQPRQVKLAVFLHDIAYDPSRRNYNDNEERSIVVARELLTKLGISTADQDYISSLILSTKGHRSLSHDTDSQYFLDADLAILGSDAARYQRYALDIRKEYEWIPEEIYKAERATILEKFLKRQPLYSTSYFADQFEAQARKNIASERAALLS